jgi:hypothetical protein
MNTGVFEYWVSMEKVYKLSSNVELTDDEVQVLIENGQGSLKEVNWEVEKGL